MSERKPHHAPRKNSVTIDSISQKLRADTEYLQTLPHDPKVVSAQIAVAEMMQKHKHDLPCEIREYIVEMLFVFERAVGKQHPLCITLKNVKEELAKVKVIVYE